MVTNQAVRLSLCFWVTISVSSYFMAFPALAMSTPFSFIELTIAFILGLSLPVLLIVVVGQSTVIYRQYLPLLLTLSLLSLLYVVSRESTEYLPLSLLLSVIFLQTSCYWSLQLLCQAQTVVTKVQQWIKNTSFILLLVLFACLLYTSIVPLNIAWLIFVVLQLVLMMFYVWKTATTHEKIKISGNILLVAHLLLAISVYVSLLAKGSIYWLVIVAVLSYTLLIAAACRQVVNTRAQTRQSVKALSSVINEPLGVDPATNLPHYQYALSYFQQCINRQSSAQYAVIVFKPINFQQLNAELGHHNSDMLLLQLAYSLQKSLVTQKRLLNFANTEPAVRMARLQGLHFLVVMDLQGNKHSHELVVEQFCQELARAVPGPMSFQSFSLVFKLAFGVAYVDQGNSNASEIIAFAEDALLQADSQQQQVNFFNQELAAYSQQQLLKVTQLKAAIAQQSLYWCLQPQIELKAKQLSGFELQLFWQQDKNNTLGFAEIMALAAYSGDVFTLSRQMVTQAFDSLRQLQDLDCALPVAIKLTAESLLEPVLIDYIEQTAERYQLDCRLLAVEVNEAILLMSSPQAKAAIDQLKSLGVQIIIDDFSGSHQALRYIRRLAINGIKIDCSTLSQAVAGAPDKAIINALITLTRKMTIPLVGSNINSLAAEQTFISMGGEYAQGQHYGAGITSKNLPRWLAAWQAQYPNELND
ncbi:EAL domain, c-di-GMP-specific phosphodiesterase class I (or its enzymatically inactive variant) [Colwellia chukchiensis]|uniref:EAL domain, c-di-GMP-specific phosphodiesterase class I (Or its enzymatically inactive variant) n=1 Tax=Colwellia chukchiensis TaxID=641665 RepID=A0A1H7RED2_9GAMM|nr:GGDEF domain-containing phosphodiesterase [Colwellia chukchiensis]SEL58543.1 EAL domain, c-di-GMP-specific phosphodiesterase class I (or its enzymatically inactive variant) [Colwellia chukchiensis]